MNNVNRNIANAVNETTSNLMPILLLCALLLTFLPAPVKAEEPPPEAGWQQHVMPVRDWSSILAMAGNRGRSMFALLYVERSTGNADELKLVAFDGEGKQTKSVDIGAQVRAVGEYRLSLRAGLAVDDNGMANVAVAGRDGVVMLARVDLRRGAAPLIRTIRVGMASVDVSTMRYTRQGGLVLAGQVDNQGFVASIGPNGDLSWTKRYDKVVAVLDLVEIADGFVLAGGTSGKMFPQAIWLARIGMTGDVLESQLKQGPARYAYLAADGRRLALSFERLDPDLEAGTALLEVFPNGASLRESTSHVLYKGRLATPFSLSGDAGGFTAAGAVERGGLRIFEVGADGRLLMLFKGQTQPPYYVSFGYLEVIRAPGSNYLGGVRTHAEGRRAETRLVFARIPAK